MPTIKKDQEIIDEFVNDFRLQESIDSHGFVGAKCRIASYFIEEMKIREANIISSFGGCTKCYGKGYATCKVQAGGRDEWTEKVCVKCSHVLEVPKALGRIISS